MSPKEYFLGTETGNLIGANQRNMRRLQSIIQRASDFDVPSKTLSDRSIQSYVRLELTIAKYIPNVATVGALLGSLWEPKLLLGAAASEAFRLLCDGTVLSKHRNYFHEHISPSDHL